MTTHIIYKNKVCRPGRSKTGEWTLNDLLKDNLVRKLLHEKGIHFANKEDVFLLLQYYLKEKETEEILVINRVEDKYLDKIRAHFGTKKEIKRIAKKYKIPYKGIKTPELRKVLIEELKDKYVNMPIIEGEEDWECIPREYRFVSEDGYCFDIRDLCYSIGQGLNHSEYGGPKPKWPFNAYNRRSFTYEELVRLRDFVKIHQWNINIALYYFFKLLEYIEKDVATRNPLYIVEILSLHLRYRRLNNLDSQGNYTGCWVRKEQPSTKFEQMRDRWIQLGQNLTRAGIKQRFKMDRMAKEDFNIKEDYLVRWKEEDMIN